MPEAAEILAEALGRPIAFAQTPIEQVRQEQRGYGVDAGVVERVGYSADIAAWNASSAARSRSSPTGRAVTRDQMGAERREPIVPRSEKPGDPCPMLSAPAAFRLGDLLVKRLGYGAMRLSGPGIFGPPRDRETAVAVLREAISSGVNDIDTSDYYGPHITNELIREALHPYPDDLVIVTKIGARRERMRPGSCVIARRAEASGARQPAQPVPRCSMS